jgi:hypothetical protein
MRPRASDKDAQALVATKRPGPRFPALTLSHRRLGFLEEPSQFLLVQTELPNALFRGQIRVPPVQSPAEELIERLNWAQGSPTHCYSTARNKSGDT